MNSFLEELLYSQEKQPQSIVDLPISALMPYAPPKPKPKPKQKPRPRPKTEVTGAFTTLKDYSKELPTRYKDYRAKLGSWEEENINNINTRYQGFLASGEYRREDVEFARNRDLKALAKKKAELEKQSLSKVQDLGRSASKGFKTVEQKALQAKIKKASGQKLNLGERINADFTQLAQAGEDLRTLGEQFGTGALDASAGILLTPEAIKKKNEERNRRLSAESDEALKGNLFQKIDGSVGKVLRGANQVLDFVPNQALNLVNKATSRPGRFLEDISKKIQANEGVQRRREENPIFGTLGNIAGQATPFLAGEVATQGKITAPLASALSKTRMLSVLKNPVARKLVSNSIADTIEGAVTEAPASIGQQYLQTGTYDTGKVLQDALIGGVASGGIATAGNLFGRGIKKAVRAKNFKKIQEAEEAKKLLQEQEAQKLLKEQEALANFDQNRELFINSQTKVKDLNKAIKQARKEGDYANVPELLRQRRLAKEQVLKFEEPDKFINKQIKTATKDIDKELKDLKRKKTSDPQAINQLEAQKKEIAEKIKQENTILPSNAQDTETVKQVKKLLGLEEDLKKPSLESIEPKSQSAKSQTPLKKTLLPNNEQNAKGRVYPNRRDLDLETETKLKQKPQDSNIDSLGKNKQELAGLEQPSLPSKTKTPKQKEFLNKEQKDPLSRFSTVQPPVENKLSSKITEKLKTDLDKKQADAISKADPRSYSLGKPPEIKDWKEFQELKRKPKTFKTLEAQAKDLEANIPTKSQSVIDELAEVNYKKRSYEGSLEKAREQLIFQMKREGKTKIKVGDQVISLGETKSKVLKQGALKKIEDFEEEAMRAGRITSRQLEDTLNIQPAKAFEDFTQRSGITNLNDSVKQFRKLKIASKQFQEAENQLRKQVKNEILDKLPEGGLRQIWRNSDADSTFFVNKGRLEVGLDKEAKAQSLALKKQAIEAGEFDLKTADRITLVKNKNIDRRIAKKALDTGEVPDAETAESIVKATKDEIEEIQKKYKGFRFDLAGTAVAGVGIAKVLLRNSDALIVGRNLIKKIPFVQNLLNKIPAKGLNDLADIGNYVIGRTKSFSTKLKKIDNSKLNKFIDEYESLSAKELSAEAFLFANVDKTKLKKIQETFQKNTTKEIQEAFDSGKTASLGELDSETFELLRTLTKAKRKRAELIRDTIESVSKDPTIPEQTKIDLDKFFRTETAQSTGAMRDIYNTAMGVFYSVAMSNRITSVTLAATDPIMKVLPAMVEKAGFVAGFKDFAQGFKALGGKEFRNSKLFKAYNAGDTGNFYQQLFNVKSKENLLDKLNKADLFKYTTDVSQDIGLAASASSFNRNWFKKTGQKIDIVKEFDAVSEASQEFALYHNNILNQLYGTGKGNIDKFSLVDPTLKPLMIFMSEPLRFQSQITRWGSQIQKGFSKNATEAERELALNSIKASSTFFAIGTIFGGSSFLLNSGGTTASLYAQVLKMQSPEKRQQLEDTINKLSLLRALDVDFGEKLGLSPIRRKPGESFLQALKSSTVGNEGSSPVLEPLKNLLKKSERATEYFQSGNTSQGFIELAKATPLSGIASLIDKGVKKQRGENMSVWVAKGGAFVELKKDINFTDIIFSQSTGAGNLKRGYELKADLVKDVAKDFKIKKVGKIYKLISANNQEGKKNFEETLDILKQKRFQLAIDKNSMLTREEIAQDVLAKAYRKQISQRKKIAKRGSVFSGDRVLATSENKLISEYIGLAKNSRQKTSQAFSDALRKAKTKRERNKIRKAMNKLNLAFVQPVQEEGIGV